MLDSSCYVSNHEPEVKPEADPALSWYMVMALCSYGPLQILPFQWLLCRIPIRWVRDLGQLGKYNYPAFQLVLIQVTVV